ncbi:MAG: vitamin B12 dependent-methionine synthase activation domain-containing protein [Ignavibacteriales bacterium]
MEDAVEFLCSAEDLPVNTGKILRQIGFVTEALLSAYEAIACEELLKLIEASHIRCGYRLFDNVNFTKNSIVLHDAKDNPVTFFTGEKIFRLLGKSEKMVLFALSLGPETDTLIKNEFDEDALRGLLIDALASELTEAAAEFLENKIAGAIAEPDLKMTNRLSPGYCEWDISEQQKLFSLLPDDFCGIHLTEASLMMPIKSVSGLIGLGRNVKKFSNSCALCGLTSCYKRNL